MSCWAAQVIDSHERHYFDFNLPRWCSSKHGAQTVTKITSAASVSVVARRTGNMLNYVPLYKILYVDIITKGTQMNSS